MAISTQKSISLSYWGITVFFIILSTVSAVELFNPFHDPISSLPSMRYSRHGIGTRDTGAMPCTVEYQVTKKKEGYCIQLDKNRHGCLADGYMELFNSDCS